MCADKDAFPGTKVHLEGVPIVLGGQVVKPVKGGTHVHYHPAQEVGGWAGQEEGGVGQKRDKREGGGWAGQEEGGASRGKEEGGWGRRGKAECGRGRKREGERDNERACTLTTKTGHS